MYNDQTSWGSNIKVDALEQFRYNFFNTLQKEEEKKIELLKRKQKNCWHKFSYVGATVCEKCGKKWFKK